ALPGVGRRATRGPGGARRRGCGGGDRLCSRSGCAAGDPDRRRKRRLPDRLAAAVTRVWIAVALMGASTVALKAAGPVLLGGRELPAPRRLLVGVLGPAVLAARRRAQA